jgi:hypothetical protein
MTGLSDMPFADTLMENPILLGVAAALALALVTGLSLLLFRAFPGRPMRAQGPQTDRSRLKIVEVFNLDRQRQLVIVGCGETEHLILIGGPNDLLIETGIKSAAGARPEPVRTEAQGLETEDAFGFPAELDFRRPFPGTGSPAPRPEPRAASAGMPAGAEEGPRIAPPPFAGAPQRPSPFPIPPRRVPPPITPAPQRIAPQHREPAVPRGRPPGREEKKPEIGPLSGGPARGPIGPLSRPPHGEPAATQIPAAAPMAEQTPEPLPPVRTGAQTPAAEEPVKEPGPVPADPIDMLEAEMAQLLGRTPKS